MTDKQTKAMLNVGELCGMAARLEIKELEQFLDNPPPDFLFEKQCRAAIAFAKVMQTPIAEPV